MQITSGLGVIPQASFWPTDRGCTPCTARSLGTVSAANLGELAFLLAAAGARPVVAIAIATLAGATPRPGGLDVLLESILDLIHAHHQSPKLSLEALQVGSAYYGGRRMFF